MFYQWRAFHLFILCVIFLPLLLGAQDSTTHPDKTEYPEPIYHTKGFDKENSNLPGNRIYSLSKTIDGAIWVGTDKGPIRYEKGKWQGFTSQESKLPGNMISVFLNAKDDSIWVATDKVVARFREGKWQVFEKERYNLPGGKVSALMKGKGGKVWLGTQQGLAYFENDKWHKVTNRAGRFSKTSINTLLETDNGALWIGTDTGLECLYKDKGTWQELTSKDRKFPNTPIATLLKIRHFLWVGTNSELGRLHISKEAWQTSIYEEKGRLKNRIITLCKTRDGSIWVGTRKKLWRFENEQFKRFRGSKGDKLKGRLNCLLDAHDGALWMGTDKGLFRIQKSRWQIFTPGNSQLPGAEIRALLTTEDGTLWAGTDKGLVYFEEETWQIFSDEKSDKDIKGRGVLELAEMGKGHLWVALEHGLVSIQNGGIRKTWLVKDPSEAIEPSGMAESAEENRRFIKINAFMMPSDKSVWVGTDEALYRYRKIEWTPVGRNNSREPISGVNALLEAKDRSLYVGTEDGLTHRRLGEWIDVDEFEGTNITALVQMEDKTLWVGHMYDENDGSPGGLHYFKDGNWKSFEDISPEDIKKNHVTALLNADEDTLWVGTKTGLARIHNKEKEMHFFTEDNCDLISSEITALSLGTDGVLWIGTPKGIACFRPPSWEERPYVELIKTSNEKVLTQRAQTFNAFAFDPKYQTESHMFTYHWKIFSEAAEVIPEQISKDSLLIHEFQDGQSYKVMVTCIDRFGYRSKPDEFNFTISLPKPLEETKPPKTPSPQKPQSDTLLKKIIKFASYALYGVLLYLLYLIPLFPLVACYHTHEWAKTAVNSAIYNKIPLGHKTILNMRWSRRRIFSRSLEKLGLGQYTPKVICQYNPSKTEDIEDIEVSEKNLDRVLESLFKGRRHAMIIGPRNSGKSNLLYYIYNLMVERFKNKKKIKAELPVLINIKKADFNNQSIEEMIYDVFVGLSIDLSSEVIDFMLRKGKFIIFIDFMATCDLEGGVKGKLSAFLTRNHNLKNKIFMASREDVLERDDINLFTLSTGTA